MVRRLGAFAIVHKCWMAIAQLIGDICIFAATQNIVEADRKGQHGQEAQHGVSVGLRDLKCACLVC